MLLSIPVGETGDAGRKGQVPPVRSPRREEGDTRLGVPTIARGIGAPVVVVVEAGDEVSEIVLLSGGIILLGKLDEFDVARGLMEANATDGGIG